MDLGVQGACDQGYGVAGVMLIRVQLNNLGLPAGLPLLSPSSVIAPTLIPASSRYTSSFLHLAPKCHTPDIGVAPILWTLRSQPAVMASVPHLQAAPCRAAVCRTLLPHSPESGYFSPSAPAIISLSPPAPTLLSIVRWCLGGLRQQLGQQASPHQHCAQAKGQGAVLGRRTIKPGGRRQKSAP